MSMISSEVQRTLVKSPPELWAELSDQASLARHLGDLEGIGEIRITRVEPETLVEWEAESATGSVAIKASGWGTKVTLRVSRELPEAETTVETGVESKVEAEAEVEPEAGAEPESEAEAEARTEPEVKTEPGAVAEPEAQTEAKAKAVAEPDATAEPELESRPLTAAERFAPEFPPSLRGERLQAEPADQAPEPQPEPAPQAEVFIERRGFFARLFGWRKRPAEPAQAAAPLPTPEPEPSPAPFAQALDSEQPVDLPQATSEPLASEPPAEAPQPQETEQEEPQAAEPEAQAPEDNLDESDLAAELLAAEEQVTAALTAVLDRLGSAHHRPFSRA
jgi:hypothetical protein